MYRLKRRDFDSGMGVVPVVVKPGCMDCTRVKDWVACTEFRAQAVPPVSFEDFSLFG